MFRFILVFVLISCSAAAVVTNSTLNIHIFNVGQADSQLIGVFCLFCLFCLFVCLFPVFPSGYTILVDLGELSYNSHKNADIVAKRIKEITGTTKIDTFVATHMHLDHVGEYPYGGFAYLIDTLGFTVGKIIDRNTGKFVDRNNDTLCDPDTEVEYIYAGTTSKTGAVFICYTQAEKYKLKNKREVAQICSRSQIVPGDADTVITIVSTDAYGAKTKSGSNVMANHVNDAYPTSENDYSIGILLRFRSFLYVTMGDLDGQYETSSNYYVYDDIESVARHRIGSVDVYHVDHHGSDHSSNQNLLSTLSPTVSLISCGDNNKYSHPSQTVLDRLANFGDIYLTNNGTYTRNYHNGVVGGELVITTDGKDSYTISTLGGTNAKNVTKQYKLKKAVSPTCVP